MSTMNDLFKAMHKQTVAKREVNNTNGFDLAKNNAPAGIGQGILNVRK